MISWDHALLGDGATDLQNFSKLQRANGVGKLVPPGKVTRHESVLLLIRGHSVLVHGLVNVLVLCFRPQHLGRLERPA